MTEKTLSVFIDESGDFGPYETHSPYYLVSMVLHDQSIDISGNISAFESHLRNLEYAEHAVHTGPLIRRESVYKNDLVENRKQLFNALFNFSRKLDIHYSCAKIRKSECPDVIAMTARLSKAIAEILRANESFWNSYDRIIIYYDNGQHAALPETMLHGSFYVNKMLKWEKNDTWYDFQKLLSAFLGAGLNEVSEKSRHTTESSK